MTDQEIRKQYEFLVSYAYVLKNLSETIEGFANIVFNSENEFLDPFAAKNHVLESIKNKERKYHKKRLDREYYDLGIVILAISRIK